MDIKLALIIPYRNDRPLFMENLHRMIKNQLLQPVHIEIVDYEPNSNQIDITERYRTGYEALKGKNIDLIAFLEVDD